MGSDKGILSSSFVILRESATADDRRILSVANGRQRGVDSALRFFTPSAFTGWAPADFAQNDKQTEAGRAGSLPAATGTQELSPEGVLGTRKAAVWQVTWNALVTVVRQQAGLLV